MSAFRLYTALGRLGLITGSSGNVSERTKHGMSITPSGGSPEGVKRHAMARMTLEGKRLNAATPSSEWEMHAALYRAFPEAGCIVHTHADSCTALACLNERLPPFHYMVVQFGGQDVRCAPHVTFGTAALAEQAVLAMRDRSACLLANHGMILHASDADQALDRAVLLETLCRQYLLGRAAGTPRLLSEAEIEAARDRFRTYGSRPKELGPKEPCSERA